MHKSTANEEVLISKPEKDDDQKPKKGPKGPKGDDDEEKGDGPLGMLGEGAGALVDGAGDGAGFVGDMAGEGAGFVGDVAGDGADMAGEATGMGGEGKGPKGKKGPRGGDDDICEGLDEDECAEMMETMAEAAENDEEEVAEVLPTCEGLDEDECAELMEGMAGDAADDEGVVARMELGITKLFHSAENYLGYSFLQMKSNVQFCACQNGQVLQYA